MKVLVATTQFPFVHGGAEIQAELLNKELKKAGHESEIIRIPNSFRDYESAVNEREICQKLDLSRFANIHVDRVICLKYPAYMVRHPHKSLWLLHQQRELYDLWDTFRRHEKQHHIGEEQRNDLIEVDRQELELFKKRYTTSKNVSMRLKEYSSLDSEVLVPPPQRVEKFYQNEPRDYIYMPSRVAPLKRQELAVRAMTHVSENIKLIISGRADHPTYEESLKRVIEENYLNERVIYKGFVSDEEHYKLYAESIGVLFIPQDEDLGYITLEAMLSSKPVISCEDSGGPTEFINHKETGLICQANEKSIAKSIQFLGDNRQESIILGSNGKDLYQGLEISWENILNKLLSF